ncbi:MAG: nuclear transport factor 2 family protein [Flavobacteriales bacterium]|nr:nuclear transport factor 2 family protein [Flavobacteriales bacterium]
MSKVVFIFVFMVAFSSCNAQISKEDKAAIHNVMAQQENCWNVGDINCFMEGYWKSDSLKFIGSKGLTYGWQQTLDNYKTSYPDKATMGQLTFDILSTELLAENVVLLIGKWHLSRKTKENIGGHFSLNWKKIDGQWVIVADHSS